MSAYANVKTAHDNALATHTHTHTHTHAAVHCRLCQALDSELLRLLGSAGPEAAAELPAALQVVQAREVQAALSIWCRQPCQSAWSSSQQQSSCAPELAVLLLSCSVALATDLLL